MDEGTNGSRRQVSRLAALAGLFLAAATASAETDKAALTITNRIQVRLTVEGGSLGGHELSGSRESFRIRRAKSKFEGWFHRKSLTYEFQMNFADLTNALEDAAMNWDVLGNRAIQVKAGQFKVPFGRQELTSSGSQQFVDRSIVSGQYALGREPGVQVHGLLWNGALDWRAGVFNGAGRNATENDNARMQYDARLTWQPLGDVKYSEADFESADTPLLALAVQVERNDRHNRKLASNDLDRRVVGGDAVVKFRGISLSVEYFRRVNEPETGRHVRSEGTNAQLGFFVLPRTVEVAFRYATFDPSNLVPAGGAQGSDRRRETGVAVNWYVDRHARKLQADARKVEDFATRLPAAQEGRVQLQFIF